MDPLDNVLDRLRDISNRITQIQRQSSSPPAVRARQAARAEGNESSESASAGAVNASPDAARFQSLLDQALSIAEIGESGSTSGSEKTSLSLLDELLGSDFLTSSSSDLARYQQIVQESIERAND